MRPPQHPERAAAEPGLKGMGTTIAAVLVDGPKAWIGWAGDSRVYRSREGKITQLSSDHSLLNDYIRLRNPTPEEIAVFPHKHVIVRALGMKPEVAVDVLVTGLFPGSGKPGPIAYPAPGNVSERIDKINVVDFVTLIQLKLAAHRHQDFGDVVALIRIHNLNENFSERLHPSVRRDFIECLDEKRREDEYEAREG